jgi:exopolysaccharide biosynthesis predicted pyruvyltransferase EpsI
MTFSTCAVNAQKMCVIVLYLIIFKTFYSKSHNHLAKTQGRLNQLRCIYTTRLHTHIFAIAHSHFLGIFSIVANILKISVRGFLPRVPPECPENK